MRWTPARIVGGVSVATLASAGALFAVTGTLDSAFASGPQCGGISPPISRPVSAPVRRHLDRQDVVREFRVLALMFADAEAHGRAVGPPLSRPVGPPASRPVGPPCPPISPPVSPSISRPVGPPLSRPVGPPPGRPVGPPSHRPGHGDSGSDH